MAIVYGSYNQVLDQYVSVQGVGSTDTFYFSIPWHKASYVNHLNVWNTTGTNFTISGIYLVNNGAHYRQGGSQLAHLMYADETERTGKAAQNYFISYEIDPEVYVENLYGRNYLDVIVTTKTAISSPKIFVQTVGRKNINFSYILADRTSIIRDKSYRVLMGKNQSGAGGTGGTCYDITGVMTGRGGENASQAGFATTNDYIYVGSTKKLDHWEFILSGVGQTNASLNAQYWTGTTWSGTGVTLADCTSSNNSDSMRYSGLIENLNIAGIGTLWKATRMSGTGLSLMTDPNYTYVEAINAGTIQPGTLAWDPARYWMRFSVSKVVGSGVTIQSLLPIMEGIDYDHIYS